MTRATLLLLATFALSATSFAAEVDSNDHEVKHMWNQWKDLHLKNYSEAEESHRSSVFAQNYKRIAEHNAKNSDVTLAMNKFGDLTAEEFKSKYTGGHHHDKSATEEEPEADAEDKRFLSSLPSSFDWRTKGALTAVKNQKDCKACWAFSSSDALEALHFIKTGSLLTFSEQQLIDCDTKAHACKSGNMLTALTYTADNGIELGSTYPFIDKEGSCKFSSSKAYNVNKGYKRVTSKSVTALKTAIVNQPVLVAIQANQDVFQFYKSGVISSGCGATTDHAVLAVGYETVNGQQAFIIKNSWGSSWGVSGYAYISASSTANSGEGVCGILSYAGYPTD